MMKRVQMPPDLIHIEDADLDDVGLDPNLLADFRAYLPHALEDRQGVAILAPPPVGTDAVLMVLARRIGAALRDDNIRMRERGGDVKAGRKKLCYLPGSALPAALDDPAARCDLANEAACFLQGLDRAWAEVPADQRPDLTSRLFNLLDERLAAGRPTFLTAVGSLPADVERELRARLPVIEPV